MKVSKKKITLPVAAQRVETGFLNRSLILEGEEYKYQVYVPREFKSSVKWPVLLALHGGGDYGNDGMRQTVGALGDVIRQFPNRIPAIVVFAQAHADGTPGWQGAGGRAALAAVDKALTEFSGDSSRVYITGVSAGGNGSWYLASHYHQRFAAIAVICGFIRESKGRTTGILYPAIAPAFEPDPFTSIARQVKHIPIWIFHGDKDSTVSVEESRQMFAALKALGADVQYTEFPDVDHAAWNPAYNSPGLFEWMLKNRLYTTKNKSTD